MDKKICVVSMSVGKPASMTAAWINNELIMAERTSYPERRRDMELQLLRELREKEEKGFIVLVEEENSCIDSLEVRKKTGRTLDYSGSDGIRFGGACKPVAQILVVNQ